MGMWLDFLQVALALGMGWLGLFVFAVARPAGARTGDPMAGRLQRRGRRGLSRAEAD